MRSLSYPLIALWFPTHTVKLILRGVHTNRTYAHCGLPKALFFEASPCSYACPFQVNNQSWTITCLEHLMNKHMSIRDDNWPWTQTKQGDTNRSPWWEWEWSQEHRGCGWLIGNPEDSQQERPLPCSQAGDSSQFSSDLRISSKSYAGAPSKHEPPSPEGRLTSSFTTVSKDTSKPFTPDTHPAALQCFSSGY